MSVKCRRSSQAASLSFAIPARIVACMKTASPRTHRSLFTLDLGASLEVLPSNYVFKRTAEDGLRFEHASLAAAA